MISYKYLKEKGLTPKKIKKYDRAYLLETDDSKYIIKENNDLNEKYNYLLTRGFNYFPDYRILDNYLLYDYIEDNNLSRYEKLNDLMSVTSLLHAKTTRYENIDIDDYKIIYESLDKKIEDTFSYYNDLNNKLDEEIYMSPSNYLLARNISKIYSALFYSKKELDNWYESIKDSSKQRKVLIHNNLDLNHIITGRATNLISFDKSKFDIPIYDLYNVYEKYYQDIDFSLLLKKYEKIYPLNEEEKRLFFIKISIPDKVLLDKKEIENTKEVKKVIEKLNSSDKIIRPYYEKNK